MRRPASALVAFLTAMSALVLLAPPGAAATALSQLDVVGSPVAAEGSVVVITADASHNLHLAGLDPSGRVRWSHPYSESAITPGLPPTIYVLDNVVIDIAPAAKANNPEVNIEGVNATTGAVAWKAEQGVVLADQPLPCAAKKYFCLIGFDNGGTAMAVLDPLTGKNTAALTGPFRALDDDLYQTDAKNPVLEELSPFGTIAWSKTVTALMGAPGYNPNNGWDMIAYGDTEVGTIGATAQGHSDGLDNAKTIGISIATGATAYTLPGQYECGGSLQFESPAFVCHFSGSLAKTKAKKGSTTTARSLKGLSLTLQGFNSSTGAITWTQPVSAVSALADGGVEFVDASHLLVHLPDGHPVVLDTTTGATAPVGRHQTFWCTSLKLFTVNENTHINPQRMRVAASPFSGCTATGRGAAVPHTTPSTIGTTVNGVFFWVAPHGLGSRVIGRPSGIA
jgi:hypothetical protein